MTFIKKMLNICILSAFICVGAVAEEINVLAAASLKYVLEDIKNAILKRIKKIRFKLVIFHQVRRMRRLKMVFLLIFLSQQM